MRDYENDFRPAVVKRSLPPLLPREPLVKQREDLGDVELHVLQVQIVLVVLLHLEQVVEFEVEL